MREAKRIEGITSVKVADVIEENRLRPVSEGGIAALISSIEDLGGITDPIHVRKVKHRDGALVLMAGSHRLEAARRLGWETIPATVWDCADDWAVLMEIDDNAAGAELSALDTAVFLAERKQVYLRLNPQTKQGGDRRSDQTDTMSVWSFARATGEKFGLTDRHVRRLVSAGERLGSGDRNLLRQAPKPVTLADLMTLAKVDDVAERSHVVQSLSDGSAKSAAKARGVWAAKTKPATSEPDPVEAEARKLADGWKRARKVARRQFVAAHLEELQELIADFDGGDEGDTE